MLLQIATTTGMKIATIPVELINEPMVVIANISNIIIFASLAPAMRIRCSLI